jgi:hypothetical protein
MRFQISTRVVITPFLVVLTMYSFCQHDDHHHMPKEAVTDIEPQPLLAQALRLKEKLIQHGWVCYLVKVINEAGITPQLQVESPNAATPLYAPSIDPIVDEKKKLTAGQVANRFLEVQLYRNQPMLSHLSGLKVEYAILQIYSKDAGQREVTMGFNVGQGTQDIGFRNLIHILFRINPSVKVTLHIKDENNAPASMASLLITDGIEHILDDSVQTIANADMASQSGNVKCRMEPESRRSMLENEARKYPAR